MRRFIFPLLFACLAAAQPSQAPLQGDARTQWFRDAKFGMFIHWGPYAVIGRHEWSRHLFQIPQAQYDTYARAFNPVNFDADQWVDIAKGAGAKYIVITSKHHDGFSIYRSKVSDYDMEITPYAGDPLKMLAAAASARICGSAFTTPSWTGTTLITSPNANGRCRARSRAATSTNTSNT